MGRVIGKKGAAHFEMIISFVFFIGFIMFLFLFLKPQGTSMVLSDSVTTGLANYFEDRASVNLSSFFLRVDASSSTSCFSVNLPEELFDYDISSAKSYVTKLDGDKSDSVLSGGILNIEKDSIDFRVSISSEFLPDDLTSCEPADLSEIGNVIEERVLSYTKLGEIEKEYADDYEGLKSSFGVPSVLDFAVVIDSDFVTLDMEPANGIPNDINVVTISRIFRILKGNGKISSEEVIFKVW